MVRDAVTWLALGLGLVTLYAYKNELAPIAARVVGELLPGTAMTVEESAGGLTEVKIRKRLNGHFTANVDVNGKSISMIVDTGASSIVATPEDAKRVGIDIDGMNASACRSDGQQADHGGAGVAGRSRHRPPRPHQGGGAGCPAW